MAVTHEIPVPLPLINRKKELLRELDVKMLELILLAGELLERFGDVTALERSVRHGGKKVIVEVRLENC